jgi:NAD-dependent deacetylase
VTLPIEQLEGAKKLVEKSCRITILTGAGMSTESGISDFRSPGGIWSQYSSVTIQDFLASREKRIYYWKYKSETIPSMLGAGPNPAHGAIAELDRKKKLHMLLTQNIDGLHERSGVREEKIIRLHGTNSEVVCLGCGKVQPVKPVLERIKDGEEEPTCRECSGFLKPNTVSFGQNLNPDHLKISERVSRDCDLFMALGSSLQVQPAASFVMVAHTAGRPVIIINREATPYDSIAAYKLSGPLAEILPAII